VALDRCIGAYESSYIDGKFELLLPYKESIHKGLTKFQEIFNKKNYEIEFTVFLQMEYQWLYVD
jgi:hypothetical protein